MNSNTGASKPTSSTHLPELALFVIFRSTGAPPKADPEGTPVGASELRASDEPFLDRGWPMRRRNRICDRSRLLWCLGGGAEQEQAFERW